jgi:hypothetical protein
MEDVIVPVEFRFAQQQSLKNTAVSPYLGTQVTETTARPVYYHTRSITYNDKCYQALFYVLFFVANPGYCFGTMGYVERVVLLRDAHTNRVEHVYFGAHGGREGLWVPYEQCEKAPSDGALVVYVSPQSHAMYPKAQRYWRVFGFANDVTSDDGEWWRPELTDFQPSEHQSWSETHYQVAPGINNPKNVPVPGSNRSITTLQRFFLPLSMLLCKCKTVKQ